MAAKRKTLPVEAVAPEPATIATPPVPQDGAWPLRELGNSQCRFPCGEAAGEHTFCGSPTEISEDNGNQYGSWCDHHLPVVFEGRAQRAPRAKSSLSLFARRSA